MELKDVIKSFFPDKELLDVVPFGNGHINDTYKVDLKDYEESYILQKINTSVFQNPNGLVNNHHLLQSELDFSKLSIDVPYLIPQTNSNFLFLENGNTWRMLNFIKGSYSVEVVKHEWQAKEAGFAFGLFAKECAKLDANKFIEAIPDFHKLSFRLNQLNSAIENNTSSRLNSVQPIVDFFLCRAEKLLQIESFINKGDIPVRVVHNDTKINNLLFKNEEAVAVIDLDTLGPGCLFFDYGDALRTISNTSTEDDKDLENVNFDQLNFKAFSNGYLNEVKNIISSEEKKLFYLAPVLMTYIMGIRFLADFLNGDVYYKTAYKDHNLVRTKVQKKLIECMEENENFMKDTIAKITN